MSEKVVATSKNPSNEMMMSIDESFFENFNKPAGEDYFKYIDDRINN